MIKKTLSTFPPATSILSQQYRNMNFRTHSQLMSHLLLVEKHQQLLLRNAESRPAREVHATEPIMREVHATSATQTEAHATQAPKRPPKGFTKKFTSKPTRYVARGTPQKPKPFNSKPVKGNCHKCGCKGHYAKECRASAYVVELYKELQQLKNQSRQNYNQDVQIDNNPDIENFMALRGTSKNKANIALLDSASIHTILTDLKFFEFKGKETSWQYCNLVTMAGSRKLKFQKGRAVIGLLGGFPLICERAMFAPEAPRNLICYKDLRTSQIHVSTTLDNVEEVLELRQGQSLFATAHAGAEGLYMMVIESITSSPISMTDEEEVCMAAWAKGSRLDGHNLATGVLRDTTTKQDLWHRRLEHPGVTVFRRMLSLTLDHNLSSSDAHKRHKCIACIHGKFSKKPSKWQLPSELPPPLYRIHGDICGPIDPPSGSFKYFFVLIDASGSHLDVSLLSTRNMVFSKLLAILIKYRNHFLDFPIKYLRLDNALEFRSHAFKDYCVALGISLTYSVPYEHSKWFSQGLYKENTTSN